MTKHRPVPAGQEWPAAGRGQPQESPPPGPETRPGAEGPGGGRQTPHPAGWPRLPLQRRFHPAGQDQAITRRYTLTGQWM